MLEVNLLGVRHWRRRAGLCRCAIAWRKEGQSNQGGDEKTEVSEGAQGFSFSGGKEVQAFAPRDCTRKEQEIEQAAENPVGW
jgi:hypothetical protein